MEYLGTQKMGTMYLGTTGIGKAYLGSDLVFQKGSSQPDRDCIAFRSISSNTVSLTCNGTCAPTLYYSTNGTTWTLWDYSALSFSNGSPLYMYGDNTSGFSSSTDNYARFVISGNGLVSCTGSIAALINGTATLKTIPNTYCFYTLFYQCDKLMYGPSLPSTTLKGNCYRSMFSQCTALAKAPELPAKTIPSGAYRAMFNGCTALATAPSLPATSLNTYCYYQMFYGCTSLTSAPYSLPATALKNYCYYAMFRGCTSLKTAPRLPALTTTSYCYYQMFYNCATLHYVNARFTTNPSTSNNTTNWLYGVSTYGTFIKNSEAEWTDTGASSIPFTWAVQYSG